MSADAESSSAADCVLCLDVCCDWMNSAQTSAIVRGSLNCARSVDCARLGSNFQARPLAPLCGGASASAQQPPLGLAAGAAAAAARLEILTH